MCLFSFCGASMWMCFLCDFSTDVQFLSISSWAELPVFGPNNSGEFLSYRIISCLSSKTVSHHSVRPKKLEIHRYPKQGIKARAKAERSLKDSPTFWFMILFTKNHFFSSPNNLQENVNSLFLVSLQSAYLAHLNITCFVNIAWTLSNLQTFLNSSLYRTCLPLIFSPFLPVSLP